MSKSPIFIMFLLLYIVVTTLIISTYAHGIATDTTGISENILDYNPPELTGIYAIDAILFAQTFLGAIIGVLFWTLPEWIFPLWANVIFIKIPLIALIAAIVEIVLP